jgi:hypothetical protein
MNDIAAPPQGVRGDPARDRKGMTRDSRAGHGNSVSLVGVDVVVVTQVEQWRGALGCLGTYDHTRRSRLIQLE